MLGRLGGIRPARRPRLVGAAVGAVVIEVLKQAMALLVGVAVDKPQYGALAAPIGIMFVLYLQSTALYGVASLTAGLAETQLDPAERQPDPDTAPAPGGELARLSTRRTGTSAVADAQAAPCGGWSTSVRVTASGVMVP